MKNQKAGIKKMIFYNKRMVKKKFFYFIILLFSLLILTHVVNAGECEYGTVRAWYSKDKINWQNATVDNAQVTLGEPFFKNHY